MPSHASMKLGGRAAVGRRKLQDKTIDQLTECFVELVLLDAKAPDSETDRLRDDIQEIEDELKARGPEHHRDLLPLAGHSDETVRFEAVAATFRVMLGNSRITANLVRRLAVATGAPFVSKSSSAPRVARMSPNKLRGLATGELVERFVEIAIAQDDASIRQETSKYNRLYHEMEAVNAELRDRNGNQRKALLPLHEHPNAQVRLKAAFATLALAPDSARAVLQRISDRNEYPQAADARGMMRALDEDTYTPT